MFEERLHMALTLTSVETRVLGCLLEKERVTPENYPMSLHGLTAACNQATAREPVTAFEEKTVEAALDELRGKKLATVIWGAGARVQKYRHNLLDEYTLERPEVALLCVLMLRGAQTPGELRQRTERLHAFADTREVDECLHALAQGDAPLVRILPPRPGQKERRCVQLLSGEPDLSEPPPQEQRAPEPSRIESLEAQVAALKAELGALREEFGAFRKQFE